MNNTSSHAEPHENNTGVLLNWLRAAVLGANDGIVSVAGVVAGVAGATESRAIIFTAGLAALVAGAISMAAGEYVSVSTQRDTERALLTKERRELEEQPEEELRELTGLYQAKGLSAKTAHMVARELTEHDAYAAHVDAELGINAEALINPWHAAGASAISFLVGAAIPLIAVMVPPAHTRVPVAFTAVVVALAITGVLSARVGSASIIRPTLRVVSGGILAMAITYGVGRIVGISV